MQKRKRIAIILPYPIGFAPGQRFRIEQYTQSLEAKYGVRYYIFWPNDVYTYLYEPGKAALKFYVLLSGFVKRFLQIWSIRKADSVYLFREMTPIGPPIFEWILVKIFKKKLIYDFDDAIWLPNTSKVNSVAAKLKWHSKVHSICAWSHTITAGNAYLADFGTQYCADVRIIPTTIDLTHHSKSEETSFSAPFSAENPLILGWTGSHSTMRYLEQLHAVFEKLISSNIAFKFRYISDIPTEQLLNPFSLPNSEWIPWNVESEVEGLRSMHIGLMPLEDTEWEKGKCGFKLLQYMAMEKACIAQAVGVNSSIIQENTGLLVNTTQDWVEAIQTLYHDQERISEMGKAGFLRVKTRFSVEANRESYLALFE